MAKEEKISGPHTLKLKKNELLCLAGAKEHDLYIIHSGRLMICVSNMSQIIPLAYLGPGEYLGELSFFDHQPRSAHAICIEDASLIRIPVEELYRQFPDWLITLANSMVKKLRRTDEVIRHKGIKKQNVESMKPLSMQEQSQYYKLIKKSQEESGIGSEEEASIE